MTEDELDFEFYDVTGAIVTLSAMERDRADRVPDHPGAWLLGVASIAEVLRDKALHLYSDVMSDQAAEDLAGPEAQAVMRKIASAVVEGTARRSAHRGGGGS